MKKALTLLALAVMAVNAHGAQVAWNVTGISFDGATLKNAAATAFTASLFYLGQGGTLASSYDQAAIDSLDVVASATGTTAKGANSGTYTLNVDSNSNGDVFGMLLAYTSGEKTYYNIASTTYTLSGFSDAGSVIDKYNLVASDMTYTTSSSTSGSVSPGGGWTAVPEPSTAALALAGLALLLKRRKA